MSEKPSLSLDARLAQLPRDMAPERDLWPEIEVRLTHGARNQRRRHFALGLAAGLAAMAPIIRFVRTTPSELARVFANER